MAGSEGRDPIEDLQTLRTEVKMYDEDLSKFEWIIVANKMDLEGAEENLTAFKQRFPKQTIIPLSADTAVKEFLKKVKSKTGKGYKPVEVALG